ncbi:putative FERM domain-containing protein FRMD8P1 isoform X2 [Pseudomyrmex gracilis]|uniref:putative FERM domain-containing protein FRMD8P1 isoform X2 n=1 Tax=Pseudomyrmex gracilis TaxID=219809 RepID=UPI000994E9EC|nr:putative FERM domain-containing protein FRMD8P1 isoform X2 [Pseudomyrmex gracilis]
MEQQNDCSLQRGQPLRRYANDYKTEGGHSSTLNKTMANQYSNTGRPTVRIVVNLMTGIFLMEVEQNATAQQILTIVQSEEGLSRIALTTTVPVFALWMCSSQLEVQLRPTHKPIELAAKWSYLVNKYSSYTEYSDDEEPLLYFRRNIFLSRTEEEQIKDIKVLELLYAEAKHNVLQGRYACDGPGRYTSLGAMQARIELGPYNAQNHTLAFFRRHRGRFLPRHYASPSLLFGLGLGLGLIGGKEAPEAHLLEQYKRIPSGTHNGTVNVIPRKLMRKYLEFCWNLPCYGAAFFQGQIERPVRGLASWITNRDMQVLIAINTSGVYIVDDVQCSLLLGLKYSELSWEMAKPSDENNLDCLPCLFLQFPVRENGTRVYKILQVFSRQAPMMDTLISGFAEDYRRQFINSDDQSAKDPLVSPSGNFTNKLSKFTLATFDDEGRCIGQMGSWSFQ